MLCNLQVFATSELSSHETNNHQCTDDTNFRDVVGEMGMSSHTFADKVIFYRSGN